MRSCSWSVVEVPYLVMVLHQLNDDSNVVAVILNGNNSHNISSVLGIRVLAVFIR